MPPTLAQLHAHYRHLHQHETLAYRHYQANRGDQTALDAYLTAHDASYQAWLAILAAEQQEQQAA